MWPELDLGWNKGVHVVTKETSKTHREYVSNHISYVSYKQMKNIDL